MSAECFCGCGARLPFGRRRAINHLAGEMEKSIAILHGAAERDLPSGLDPMELAQLAAEGDQVRQIVRARVHGEISRSEMDRDRVKRFLDAALDVRKSLALSDDLVGWNALRASELSATGARAPGEIVAVEDTGMTINECPRVLVRIRVTPDAGEPFKVERKLTVSRIEIPRRGERVEVAYDPADPAERFTFRVADLTDGDPDGGGDGPVGELERLARLRDSGALTEEEFAQAKARVLDGGG